MTRKNVVFLALGGLVIGAASIPAVQAQTRHALVLAERACVDNGVARKSPAFNRCAVRAASAYDRGDHPSAQHEAQATGNAHTACLSFGLDQETLGYRQCIANLVEPVAARAEFVAPTTIVRTDRVAAPKYYPPGYDDYVLGPQLAAQ